MTQVSPPLNIPKAFQENILYIFHLLMQIVPAIHSTSILLFRLEGRLGVSQGNDVEWNDTLKAKMC